MAPIYDAVIEMTREKVSVNFIRTGKTDFN